MRDIWGSLLSVLCIFHCVLPSLLFVLGGVSLFGLHVLWVHMALFVPIFALVMMSLPPALNEHGNWRPMQLALIGLVCLLLSMLSHELLIPHEFETPFSVVGSIALISAHLINRRLLSKHRTAESADLVNSE